MLPLQQDHPEQLRFAALSIKAKDGQKDSLIYNLYDKKSFLHG